MFYFQKKTMVWLKSQTQVRTSALFPSSYASQLLLELKAQELSSVDSVVLLSSNTESVFVHRVLLRNASSFMHTLLQGSCSCQDVLILPSSPPSTLFNLVTLLYRGHISNLLEEQAMQVSMLAKYIGIEITKDHDEMAETAIDDESISVQNSDDDNSDYSVSFEHAEERSNKLVLETIICDKKTGNNLSLHFPESRIERGNSEVKIKEQLSGFEGRVQTEYNKHAVGQFMGPYDQNEKLNLNLQLPNTDLDFQNYTEFYHDGDQCYQFSLKSYDRFEDLNKIGAYRIKTKLESVEDFSSDDSEKSEEN